MRICGASNDDIVGIGDERCRDLGPEERLKREVEDSAAAQDLWAELGSYRTGDWLERKQDS
jgi:hypothetical protein